MGQLVQQKNIFFLGHELKSYQIFFNAYHFFNVWILRHGAELSPIFFAADQSLV